ncbi:MAG: hypothetical protein ACFFCY_05340 [Promethearchaeota archaeon]
MQKLTILKFFLPIAVLASVFSGPTYNLLLFLNIGVFESHWSLYFDITLFSNLMALSFILFTLIFILSTRFIEKILKEQFIVIGVLLVGFCSIFASLIWVWEIVLLVFIITSVAIAFLIPMIIKYTSNLVQNNYENKRYLLALPVSALIWVVISFTLFNIIGVHWRFLYAVTGIINIASSFVLIFI